MLEGFGVFDDVPPRTVPAAPEPEPEQSPVERAKAPASATGEHGRRLCALDVAVREVLSFPVALFPRLPVATTLHGATATGKPFCVTTSRDAYARARKDGVPVFVGGELLALASGAQNDRMFARDFERAVERKRNAGDWRAGEAYAFAGMHGARVELSDTFAATFARLGATLVRVEVHA